MRAPAFKFRWGLILPTPGDRRVHSRDPTRFSYIRSVGTRPAMWPLCWIFQATNAKGEEREEHRGHGRCDSSQA